MVKMYAVLCLLLAISCRPKSTYDFANHKFDQKVIDKIPIYDSLAKLLIQNFPSIQEYFKQNPSYHYEPYWDSVDLYKRFPQESAAHIDKVYHLLGDNFIYAFEVFRDSSVRFSIRDSYNKEHQLTIREYLSYYPNGATSKKRDFLFKDTIVNKNWLYWVLFDE